MPTDQPNPAVTSPALTLSLGGRFHGLVLAYLAQVHGLLELSSRGMLADMDAVGHEHFAQSPAEVDERTARGLKRLIGGSPTPLFEDITLKAITGAPLAVDVKALAADMFAHHLGPLRRYNLASAGALLLLSWELTSEHHTHDPIWEFMRHCRNAVAHGGRFTLKNGEPRRPAKWRTLAISPVMAGSSLFVDPPDLGLIGPGDVIHLLQDLETAFPQLAA